jgi:hypothetical protein
MSTIPYNKYTVRDLSNVKQPYVNSTSEVGYFTGTSLGTIPQNKWRSLPAVLVTNNGIANVDASGVRILNAGIYSINLTLFPTSTQDVSSNISFNFGTTYLVDVSTNEQANSFGGVCPTGMFTFDISNNPYSPGIISWVADGYSSGNTGSNFVKTQTNELSYNYSTAGTGRQIYSGNCTTKMTFILNSSATIFFNVSTNSSTGVTMGSCVFTLQLISTYTPRWTFTLQSNSIVQRYNSISSSSNGQYLAAAPFYQVGQQTDSFLTVSSDYGVTWSEYYDLKNYGSIASSSDGSKIFSSWSVPADSGKFNSSVAISSNYGVSWSLNEGPYFTDSTTICRYVAVSSSGSNVAVVTNNQYIYTSTNSGVSWTQQTASGIRNWTCIASSSDGSKLAATVSNGYIYTSTDYGATWSEQTASGFRNWSTITSSSDGTKLAAGVINGYIYTSTNSGVSWTQQTASDIRNWGTITSSSNGTRLAAVSGYIYTSSNSGVSWSQETASGFRNWNGIASSSDGTRLAAVAGAVYTGVYSY